MVERGGSEEGFGNLWLERYARMAEREPASQVLYGSSPNSAFTWCSDMMVLSGFTVCGVCKLSKLIQQVSDSENVRGTSSAGQVMVVS